jgi:hypothetical protein
MTPAIISITTTRSRGTRSGVLPNDRVIINHGGDRFYYSGGVWYRQSSGGYVVVTRLIMCSCRCCRRSTPPSGLAASRTTMPTKTYYVWRPDQGQYEVVPPPDDSVGHDPRRRAVPMVSSPRLTIRPMLNRRKTNTSVTHGRRRKVALMPFKILAAYRPISQAL